jgi:hypothetical protein
MWCGVCGAGKGFGERTRDVWDVLCFFFLIDGFYSMWTGLTESTVLYGQWSLQVYSADYTVVSSMELLRV